MIRAWLCSLFFAASFACSAFAQSNDLNRQLAAMEQTLFGQVYCKDKPIRRIERLEENFLQPSKQKEKDLPSRLADLLDKIKPSHDLLDKPDPCELAKSKRAATRKSNGLVEKLIGSGEVKNSDIESSDYPVIKWRTLPIPEIQDGVAKLTTDFESGRFDSGILKYRLVVKLPKDSVFPRYFVVSFFDDNRFKLNEFVVNKENFREADNPDHWEANTRVRFGEKDYKRARAYSVRTQ